MRGTSRGADVYSVRRRVEISPRDRPVPDLLWYERFRRAIVKFLIRKVRDDRILTAVSANFVGKQCGRVEKGSTSIRRLTSSCSFRKGSSAPRRLLQGGPRSRLFSRPVLSWKLGVCQRIVVQDDLLAFLTDNLTHVAPNVGFQFAVTLSWKFGLTTRNLPTLRLFWMECQTFDGNVNG